MLKNKYLYTRHTLPYHMKQVIYSKKCPECNKVISSLQQEQFNYNFEQHLEAHKRKKEGETNGKNNNGG